MITAYNISEEQIQWLEETFPNKLPSKDCDLGELRFLQGQQDIINFIKATYNESIEDVYNMK